MKHRRGVGDVVVKCAHVTFAMNCKTTTLYVKTLHARKIEREQKADENYANGNKNLP